jgi:4-amino-4-deoxy-L-arabinose transferase-like glycosyltransferase
MHLKRRTEEAGFAPLFATEFLVVMTLLAIFLAIGLGVYRQAKQHGGSEWAAIGTGAALGLLADALFVAGIYLLIRLVEWWESKNPRPTKAPQPDNSSDGSEK